MLRRNALLPLALLGAVLVTLLLFLVMQGLISLGVDSRQQQPRQQVANFIMPEHELTLLQQQQKPEKPELASEPPPRLDVKIFEAATPDQQQLRVKPMKSFLNVELGGIGLGMSDGEYLPLVRPPPVYPRHALARGLEGYVIVEFVVTRNGTVTEPRVIKAEPQGLFEKAALRAVKAYKYKPKMVDGESVSVTGVRQKFTFKLESSS